MGTVKRLQFNLTQDEAKELQTFLTCEMNLDTEPKDSILRIILTELKNFTKDMPNV